MAAIPAPSIPLDLCQDLFNPLLPWHVSQPLFNQLQSPYEGALYRKVQVLPENKEWRLIWKYFHHNKPLRYNIKQVHFIYERHQQQTFESNFSAIEREAMSFPPTWDKESRASQRAKTIQRWKESAQIFSPFTTQEPDGRNRHWTHTKIIPLWHGTNQLICDSICKSGFIFFGKKGIPGADNVPPKSSDDGYFGSGIYFTNSAKYAADIYSQGHLMLTWVSMREPFPVVGDPDQLDMKTLRGLGAYKDYNAHYIPVVPTDPKDPYCSVYHPTGRHQMPVCDEYVVFQKSQTLPQFWVELEIELPYIRPPHQTPQIVEEKFPEDNPSIQPSSSDTPPQEEPLQQIPQSKTIIFPPPSPLDTPCENRDPTLFWWRGKVYRLQLPDGNKFPHYDSATWKNIHEQAIQLLENGDLSAEPPPANNPPPPQNSNQNKPPKQQDSVCQIA